MGLHPLLLMTDFKYILGLEIEGNNDTKPS